MSAKRPLSGLNCTVFILVIGTMVTAPSNLARLQAQSCTTYSIVGIPAGTTAANNGSGGVIGPVSGFNTNTQSGTGTCPYTHTTTAPINSQFFVYPSYTTGANGITYGNVIPKPFTVCNGQIATQGSGQVQNPHIQKDTFTSNSTGQTLTEAEIDYSNPAGYATYTSVYNVTTGVQTISYLANYNNTVTDPAGCTQSLSVGINYQGTVTWPINPPPVCSAAANVFSGSANQSLTSDSLACQPLPSLPIIPIYQRDPPRDDEPYDGGTC